MDNNRFKDSWEELKTKIKDKWDRFSEDDIELMKGEGEGDLQKLTESLCKQYGIAKETANQQAGEFLKSFKESIGEQEDVIQEGMRSFSKSFNSVKDQVVEKAENIKEDLDQVPEAIIQYVKDKPVASLLGVLVCSAVVGFLVGRR